MIAEPTTGRAPTRELAAWIAGTRAHDVPAHVAGVLHAALLDTLAAGIYGVDLPWTRAVRDWAGEVTPKGPASSVWGEAAPTVRAADAALVNGVAAHALELDDYHNAKVHPGAAVIPAALALAEARDQSGEALFTAIAVGYETMIRTSLALGPIAARLRGWHLTGVCGTFGAAAACASLMGFDAEHTAWALGLAGTQSAGLWAFNADGAMSKRLHAGRAAHAGLFAAELAERGYTGPTSIYEYGDGGVLKAFADSTNTAPLLAELGTRWESAGVCFKPYSCCGSNHSSVDAARELRAKFGAAASAGAVRVGASHPLRVQCGMDYVPSTELHAQMSLRYCVAVALLDGHALPAQFTPQRFNDPAAIALAERIEIVSDPELDALYPAHFAGWVEAMVDGKAERVFIRDPLGSPARTLDRKLIGEKARMLLEDRYSSAQLGVFERAVDNVRAGSARDLVRQLAPR